VCRRHYWSRVSHVDDDLLNGIASMSMCSFQIGHMNAAEHVVRSAWMVPGASKISFQVVDTSVLCGGVSVLLPQASRMRYCVVGGSPGPGGTPIGRSRTRSCGYPRASNRSDGLSAAFSSPVRVVGVFGSGCVCKPIKLLLRFDRRLPLEESSLTSTVWARGVCMLGEVGVRSDIGIGVPVDARNFGLFLGA
jgi:hypothetical protein